eukprot:TRINITY_DN708_c4_g1_i1.p1 TRINITY_DN708_c4_g1~~TRINITY_DN708_c4_g1_i1.p1  ORF type:complete len:193 (-),score=77.60 TRINITY_DN708_c4_g1_i1:119-697(-)
MACCCFSKSDQDPQKVGKQPSQKITVLQYILENQTLLSLFFVKYETNLEFLKSLAVFIFTLLASLFIATLATLEGLEAFKVFLITIFVVPVAVCTIEALFDKFAEPTETRKIGCGLTIMTALLLALIGTTIYFLVKLAQDEDESLLKQSLLTWIAAWGTDQALEIPTLIWKYYCCRTCCPCCIPNKEKIEQV